MLLIVQSLNEVIRLKLDCVYVLGKASLEVCSLLLEKGTLILIDINFLSKEGGVCLGLIQDGLPFLKQFDPVINLTNFLMVAIFKSFCDIRDFSCETNFSNLRLKLISVSSVLCSI